MRLIQSWKMEGNVLKECMCVCMNVYVYTCFHPSPPSVRTDEVKGVICGSIGTEEGKSLALCLCSHALLRILTTAL